MSTKGQATRGSLGVFSPRKFWNLDPLKCHLYCSERTILIVIFMFIFICMAYMNKYSILLYFVHFLEFSAYQFLGKYIRKYRCIITDVKNGICPISITCWSGFRTSKQNCENSDVIKLGWLDSLQLSLLCFFCFSYPPFFVAWHLLRLYFGGKPFWENFYSDCTLEQNKVGVGSRTRFSLEFFGSTLWFFAFFFRKEKYTDYSTKCRN